MNKRLEKHPLVPLWTPLFSALQSPDPSLHAKLSPFSEAMAAQEMRVRAWWFLSFCCSWFVTHCCSMGSFTSRSPFRVVLSPVPPLHPCSSSSYPGIFPASAQDSLLFLQHLSLLLCSPSCPGISLVAPSSYHPFLNMFSQRHHRLLWLKFWWVVGLFVSCGAGWKWL